MRRLRVLVQDSRRLNCRFRSGSRGRGTQIGLVDVQTGEQRMLNTNGPGVNDETPSWLPDGKRLAIQSDRGGSWNIYIIDFDGKTLAQLTRAQ